MGPNYKRPPLDVPGGFRSAPAIVYTNALGEVPWWEIFRDDALRNLISTALTNNYDLRVAIARVEQARAILAQNRALFFPQLNYQGSVSRGKNTGGGSTLIFTGGNTVDTLAIGGSAAWELDLWGRIRRLNESARAQLLASQEARRDVTISLIGEVAQAYFRLLALDQQLAIAQRSTNSFGESLRIFSQRMQGGVVSKLETSAAEAALASAAATVPEFERQITVQENLINVL
ncbi:MAG TPA: TolC family protein, partial [Candidatus Sulfotelmatobacter sp.]|nr:TolC family protein [Candidatus Sulfotelmatobacter sp.]